MATIPKDLSREDLVRGVDHVIHSRETKKVLGDVQLTWQHPLDRSDDARREFDQQVQAAIAIAGWAPFHHSRKSLDVHGERVIHEPWRFYYLDRTATLALLGKIDDVLDESVRRGKIPSLLAGAGALVIVTWLPETAGAHRDEMQQDDEKMELRNQEHLAAASAAVQNLLLAAEARGLETYWSSGGLLRDERIFQLLDIPSNEQLLASAFLAPPLADYAGVAIEVNPGGLRDSRSESHRWCRPVVF